MVLEGFIGKLAMMGGVFKTDSPVVGFDCLFEIVNVNELNVKLVVIVLYIGESFFGERPCGNLLELTFATVKLVTQGTQRISPITAFP